MVLSHTTGFPNWRGNSELTIQFDPVANFSYSEIQASSNKQITTDKETCEVLAKTIESELTQAENKIKGLYPTDVDQINWLDRP